MASTEQQYKNHRVTYRADDLEMSQLLRMASVYGNRSAAIRRGLALLEEDAQTAKTPVAG